MFNITLDQIQKRFNSSVYAYKRSIANIGNKHHAFSAAHAEIFGLEMLFFPDKDVRVLALTAYAEIDALFTGVQFSLVSEKPAQTKNDYRRKIIIHKDSALLRFRRNFVYHAKRTNQILSAKKSKIRNIPISKLFAPHSSVVLAHFSIFNLGSLKYRVKNGLLDQVSKQQINWPDGGFCAFGIPLSTEARIIEVLEYYS